MRKRNKQTLVSAVMLVLLSSVWSASLLAGPPANYPVPPESDHLLFYLQRSMNANTVVYDANLKADGQLSSKKPVNVYWLRYNTDGERRALNFAERNFAYGLNFDSDEEPGAYLINLMAYSDRDITVFVNPDGKAVAHTVINDQVSRLKRVYIDVSGSGFWSSVNYIELTGVTLHGSKEVTERFDPNDE